MTDEINAALEAIWEEAYRFGSDGGSDYHEKDAVFANTRAAIEAHEARKVPDGWQPIETAPKDKTVLLYGAKRLEMCVGMNHSRDGWVTDTTREWASMYPPTHWMPLPDVPSASAPPAPQASVVKQEPYPTGDVVGPCLCGSWPGGKCLKCPRITHPAPVREPLHDDIQSVLFEVEQAIGNGCCPWQIEAAFEAYEAARRLQEPAHGITKDTP